ncbi:MAG: hypothetical protein EXR98_07065 [Gemmataceae bacterium]|nr:hypothetical protein [Gemmataceae bacterium]
MILSELWPWHGFRAKKVPTRRNPTAAQMAVEQLEDRLVPTLVGPSDAAYQLWRNQTFKIDDASVASSVIQMAKPTVQAAAAPANASFGAMIGLPAVFANYPYRGNGYSVAVIDTGIDYTNPSLGGGFGPGHRVIAGWDFANNDANPMDDNGHGTHVAGIIGSSNMTYSGVAPNVNLIALKVLAANGTGSFGNVQNALDWVVANRTKYNIVAVNLSLGSGNYTTNPYTFLDPEFSNLTSNGVFISVAAGNSFYTYNSAVGLDYPAVNPYVVSVGAVYDGNFGQIAWGSGARDYTTAQDRVASFSQRGSALSIMAPGAMITSTYLNNTFQAMAGTSMAAPVIAGAAAILHQAMDAQHLAANQTTILSVMRSTGVTVVDGDDENDNVTNTGLSFKRIHLAAALGSLGNGNLAPTVQPIANQKVAPGGTRVITLIGSDPEGNPLSWSANVINASQTQAYQLKQQLGLTYAGSYYTNIWGQNEKWMSSTSGAWYCIVPSGDLRRWTGSMTTTMQAANLVATLGASCYADPSLLWNAQEGGAGLSVSVSGNQLTIQTPAGVEDNFQIQVTASDGKLSASQTFTLSTLSNTAPQIGAIANQAMATVRGRTITLTATDAENNAITYNARIVGAYAKTPGWLFVKGNQLTIYTSARYVGSFTVQVTASDGSLTSSTTFAVNVTAAPVVASYKGDFNGDGTQDAAYFHQNGEWWVSLKLADGSRTNKNWSNWAPASSWKFTGVGDFNGDGKTDIVGFAISGSWWVGHSTGTALSAQLLTRWAAASAFTFIQVGDFNGDGKTDIAGFTTGGSWLVGLTTSSTVPTKLWAQWSAASNWPSLSADDVNGDGKLDLMARDSFGKWYVAYSTGTAFRIARWTAATPPTAAKTGSA